MNIFKIVISYLLGIVLVHLLIIPGSIGILIPMILFMGFHLDESMSVLINIYIVGSLTTYLCYYLLTCKKIAKLFKYCWLIIGGLIVAFYTHNIDNVIYKFTYNHFMTSAHDYYFSHYLFQSAFSTILVYIVCQLAVLLLYFIAKSFLGLWGKMFTK